MEEDSKQQIMKEDDLTSQILEEDPKSKGLEEEDAKSKGLEEEDPRSQSLKEDHWESQSMEEDPRLNSFKEEPKSQSLVQEGTDGSVEPGSNENALQFLDSVDGYLALLDSLSWTLRQGWLQLASARHSMGGSRVGSAVLDMKSHSAATFLQVTNEFNRGAGLEQSNHYTLQKWTSSGNMIEVPHTGMKSHLRQRKDKDGAPPPVTAEADHQLQLQKERLKSLSVFGALVSPKLRAAQLSFETALDAIVEIANMRSLMLSSSHEVRRELEAAKGKH